MPELETAVDVQGLTRRYGERVALDAVSFEVAAGQIFGLLGPNGGGKSTLFKILSTVLPPSDGRASIFGHDVRTAADEVRARIGVVFQSSSLDAKLTVAENLRHQGHLYGLVGAPLARRAGELLERFGLDARAGEPVETLSGGLARRVEIAKGMLHAPRLLLLDEPSTGLDPGARRSLWEALVDCRSADGVTILMTTHLLDEAEGCDRLVLLDEGRLVADGSPADLKAEIPGSVVSIATPEPGSLAADLADRLGVRAKVEGNQVSFEHGDAHSLVARLAGELGDRFDSITVGRPTLGDVFFARTGRRMEEATGP